VERKPSIALGAVLAIMLAAIFPYTAYKKYEAGAIVSVINQNGQAVGDCTVFVRFRRKLERRFKTPKFVNELRNIDTSACPKRFQLAWLDYVQAWEREGEITPDRNLVDFLFGVGGVYTKSSRMAGMAAEPFEVRDALTQSWQKVERIALEYDVRVVYQPIQHN
jgi:hypothetical protein